MELVGLRTFQAVVEEGGVMAAAKKLNTVQSNVTNRIRRLEEELGSELFFRRGRRLELAPSGRVLLEYAEKMLHLAQVTSVAVRQVGESCGELRVGSMETFAALHLPTALKAVRARHPGLELRLGTDTTAGLIDRVLAHKLDCAFVAGPISHPGLIAETLIVEDLVQVCARGADPQQLPVILFREGCAYRARALAWQRANGLPNIEVMDLGTLEGILGCVAVGLGWTLIPRRVVQQSVHVDELQVSEVPVDIAEVPTVMIRPADGLPLPALDTLRAAVIERGSSRLAHRRRARN